MAAGYSGGTMGDPSDELPRSLRARYRVRRRLGAGAGGQVLLAQDLELDRAVAIKVLRGHGDLATPERFEAEAMAMARLQHPNVLQVFGHGVEDGVAYLVLEYAEGGTLVDLMAEGPLDPAAAVPLARAVLEALARAHEVGVLHRDVKPENVLLDAAGTPKLADFGLSAHGARSFQTRSGIILGTPEYMAPEVLCGRRPTPGSDLYSWGCLLFALLEGHPPHTGSIAAIAQAAQQGALPPEVARSPLAEVLRLALAADPAARPPASRLLAALQRTRPTAPLPTRAVETPGLESGPATRATRVAPAPPKGRTPPAPPPRTRPLLLGAASLALVALAWSSLRPAAPARPPAPPPLPLDPLAARLEELDVASMLARLQGIVLFAGAAPNQESQRWMLYQWHMAETRVPGSMTAGPRLDEIRDETYLRATPEALAQARVALGDLPALLEAGRARWEERLRDPARPLGQRRQDYLELVKLQHLDAWFRAWRAPPPFEVDPLLHQLYPVRIALPETPPCTRKIGGTLEQLRKLPEGPDAPAPVTAPGEFMLHHWAREPRRLLPVIYQDAGPTPSQQVTLGALQMNALGLAAMASYPVTELHRSVTRSLRLDPGLRRRLTRVALRLRVANVIPPDAFLVQLNHERVLARPHLAASATEFYWPCNTHADIEVDFPLEALGSGERLDVTARPAHPPGLPAYYAADLYTLTLILEAGPG